MTVREELEMMEGVECLNWEEGRRGTDTRFQIVTARLRKRNTRVANASAGRLNVSLAILCVATSF